MGMHGVGPIIAAREDWNNSPNSVIVREVLRDRLEQPMLERIQGLKNVTAEDLPKKQGEIAALELAISIVTQKPLLNDL